MGKWTDEALRMKPFTHKGIQTLSDTDAINVKNAYFTWAALTDDSHEFHKVNKDFKFTHNAQLYKTAQPEYTFVKQYVPGAPGTESLFTAIYEGTAGTIDSPIIAQRNMEYTYFLYYLDPEDDLTYLCQFGDTNTQGTIKLAYLPHEAPTYFKVAEAK